MFSWNSKCRMEVCIVSLSRSQKHALPGTENQNAVRIDIFARSIRLSETPWLHYENDYVRWTRAAIHITSVGVTWLSDVSSLGDKGG